MMSKLYVLPLLLFTQTSFATESLDELIKKLESKDEIKCEEMTHEELADHCAREVCGTPGAKSSRLTTKNLNKFLTQEQQQELKAIESEVKAIFQKKKQQLQSLVNELKKRSKDPNFHKTTQWQDHQYQDFAGIFWKYIQWEVDPDRPLRDRSQLTIKDNVPPSLIPGIKEFAANFNKSTYDDPLYAYQNGIYNEEEMKEVILKKAEKLQKELSTLNRSSSFNLQKFSSELSKLKNEEEIASQLQKIEDLASDNGVVITPKNYYCQTNCKKSIDQFIKDTDIKTEIEALEASIQYSDELDKIAECKANFVTVNQQNNNTKNFEKIWPEVKAAYYKNVLPRFSEHSQKMLADYLENGLHFYFDNPTYDVFPDLKEKKMELAGKDVAIEKRRDSDLITELFGQLDPDLNLITADLKICNTSSYHSSIWDSYLAKENVPGFSTKPYYDSNKDNISVSPYTCEHHAEGSAILAHELGHALSKVMTREGMSEESKGDYRNIRICASSQWDLNPPAEYEYHPGDKQFSEEDTADIISYMAINDGKSMAACGFLDVSPTGDYYDDFNVEPWGTHSPSLVRLLRELSYKSNNIPKTCSALMAKNQDKLGDKKCF